VRGSKSSEQHSSNEESGTHRASPALNDRAAASGPACFGSRKGCGPAASVPAPRGEKSPATLGGLSGRWRSAGVGALGDNSGKSRSFKI